MSKISVVVPCFNEEEALPVYYREMCKVMKNMSDVEFELLFVDDGSKDATLAFLKGLNETDARCRYLSFSRNFGHQAAVQAGLKYTTGNAVVIMDADLQDPPELIKEMIDLWENGNEVIYAKRTKRKGESSFKLLTAKMFYQILNGLSNVEIPKDTGDFRLADRKVIDVINSMPEHNKFLRGLFSWVGFKQTPLEYERNERYAGKTKYPLGKMLKLAKDGIFSFSTKPLKFVGMIGVISIFISILILIYSFVSYFCGLNQLTAGWTSIMVTVTFFTGIQLLSLWIISEYIARIYEETQNRPIYIIDKKINIE